MNNTPYILLAHYILPKELDEHIELSNVAEEQLVWNFFSIFFLMKKLLCQKAT